MDYIHQWTDWLTRWTDAHLYQIALALVASLLALYAGDIRQFIRRRIAKWPFVGRTAVYVLVSGFGFGLVVVAAAPYLAGLLSYFGGMYTLLFSFGAFVAVGVLAERKRQI